MSVTRSFREALLCAAALLLVGACAKSQKVGTAGAPPRPANGRAADAGTLQPVDVAELYRGMGLISAKGGVPYVGRVAFLPDRTADSTLVLVSISFAPRSLAFARENNQYTAGYTVQMEVRDGPTLVRRVEAKEAVRVATFRETARTDESLIWQQYVRLPAGQYTLGIAMRDAGSPRSSGEEVSLTVPALKSGQIASLIPVYDVVARSTPDSLPRLMARPRATVTFGADSVVPVYIEIPGTRQATSVHASIFGEGDALLWRDSTILLSRGGDLTSGVMMLPVARMGMGVVTLEVTGGLTADTARTKLLVTLGDDLPVAGFEEMISYLRFFASEQKLQRLSSTTGAERAAAWRSFLAETDPNPGTTENEALRDYFARIRLANQRFREDGPVGWLSDRGTAFVGLGDPDNVLDGRGNDLSSRNQQQLWEYRQWRLQLVFIDQTGLGRWRLSPSGSVELAATIRRKLAERP